MVKLPAHQAGQLEPWSRDMVCLFVPLRLLVESAYLWEATSLSLSWWDSTEEKEAWPRQTGSSIVFVWIMVFSLVTLTLRVLAFSATSSQLRSCSSRFSEADSRFLANKQTDWTSRQKRAIRSASYLSLGFIIGVSEWENIWKVLTWKGCPFKWNWPTLPILHGFGQTLAARFCCKSLFSSHDSRLA